jgi:hypothetical protein
MFRRCVNRVLRIGAWLTGGVMLASSGCQVAESVLGTLAAVWDIVDIWV